MGIALGIATLSGLLASTRLMSKMLVSPLAGFLSDILGRYRASLFSFFGMILSMTLLSLTHSILAILIISLTFILSNFLEVVLATEVADLAASQDKARELIISLYVNWMDLGLAIGPLIAYLLRVKIEFQKIYLGAALTLLLTAILHLYTMKER